MKTLRTLGVTVVLGMLGAALSLGCGGKSEAEAPPACPASLTGACTGGEACSETSTDCHGLTSSVTCSCTGGQWDCPVVGPVDCAPPPVCMAYEGMSCTTKGQSCVSETDCAQGGGPVGSPRCVCDGASFHCTATVCPPPPMMCPPPSTIHEGGACQSGMGLQSCMSDEPVLDCDGNVIGQQDCFCSGDRWTCPTASPPCAVDGGVIVVDAGGGPG